MNKPASELNSNDFIGQIDSFDGYTVKGKIKPPQNKKKQQIFLFLNQELVGTTVCKINPKKLNEQIAFQLSIQYFRFFRLSRKYNNEVTFFLSTKKHEITGISEGFLKVKPPKVHFRKAKNTESGIRGILKDQNYPNLRLHLDIFINEKKWMGIQANLPKDTKDNYAFLVNLSKSPVKDEKFTYELFLQNTPFKLFSGTAIFYSLPFKVKAIETFQQQLKNQLFANPDDNYLRWLVEEHNPSELDKMRDSKPPVSNLQKQLVSKTVEIIIPVYEGYEDTKKCIDSVIAAKNQTPVEILVINDKSPNEKIKEYFNQLSQKEQVVLIQNKENKGFVKTINVGVNLHLDRDIILLNADTKVADFWVDRLRETAYTSPEIGTVTPFSNNATICSFPQILKNNPVEDSQLSTLSDLFYKYNQGGLVDIPTAHGCCMYIKNQTIQEVGLFDEENFGKGYGEENDFSLRATRLGWRNVLSCHSYIYHKGSVSFSEKAAEYTKENLQKLKQKYPDYPKKINEFIKNDSPRSFRNKIAKVLFDQETTSRKKVFLMITLGFGGGTEKAENELSEIIISEGKSVYILESVDELTVKLYSYETKNALYFDYKSEFSKLIETLKSLHIIHLHYHHTIQFDKTIWKLPKVLNTAYDVTLHDYYTVCPRVNFVNDSETYCGEPDVKTCNACIQNQGVHKLSLLKEDDFDADIEVWRKFFFEKLKNARKVIVPSQDTKQRILNYFPLKNIVSLPHHELRYQLKSKEIFPKIKNQTHIAFLGSIGVHKGYNVLKELCNRIKEEKLDFRITIIGETRNDDYFEAFNFVEITGKYQPEQLPNLVEKHNPDIFALFSIWPETYGYTVSEALRYNIPIVCFDIGAYKERIDPKSPWITKIPLNTPPEKILDTIWQFVHSRKQLPEAKIGQEYESIINDYYRLTTSENA